jgi:hypothetical protein
MSDENQTTASTQNLTALLEKIIPLAELLSAKLLRFAIFTTLVAFWLGIFCYRLNAMSIVTSAIIVGVSLIPAAVFYTYYFTLQDIVELTQKIPDFHAEVKQSSKDLADDLKKVKEIKREDINALNLWSTGRKVFDLIGLVKAGKGILGQYLNLTFLLSPISLILFVSSLLGLTTLALIFVVTLIVAIA